jgi:hypothetical protein
MLETILGTFHGNNNGVRRGDIVDIPEDWIAKRYIVAGKATAKLNGDLPTAGESQQEADALREEVGREVRESVPAEHRNYGSATNVGRNGYVYPRGGMIY